MLLRTVNAGFPPTPFPLFRVQRDFNINSLLNETNILVEFYRVGAKYSWQQVHMATMAQRKQNSNRPNEATWARELGLDF